MLFSFKNKKLLPQFIVYFIETNKQVKNEENSIDF